MLSQKRSGKGRQGGMAVKAAGEVARKALYR